VSTYLLGQPDRHRLDKCPDPVQNADGFDHIWLLDVAWISEHPCILCELNHLVDEWFQRLVQFDSLFAQLPKVVRLGKRLIMPQNTRNPFSAVQCRQCSP
jgi:hypothetical protein